MVLTGCTNPDSVALPLKENDVKQLMAEKVDVAGWDFSKQGDTYAFSSVPSDPNAEGITFNVNAKTGTVYENISGLPQTNLVVKDAPNLTGVSNGDKYMDELMKYSQQVLDMNGLVPDRDDWINGGYGDGYLYGDVKKDGKKITIKLDIFTKEWEEVDHP